MFPSSPPPFSPRALLFLFLPPPALFLLSPPRCRLRLFVSRRLPPLPPPPCSLSLSLSLSLSNSVSFLPPFLRCTVPFLSPIAPVPKSNAHVTHTKPHFAAAAHVHAQLQTMHMASAGCMRSSWPRARDRSCVL